MLEIKNLKKVYKTKGGQEVRALDDVSVTFPETGMVFLLGKSGSGKSTLLNVTGGLDKPDSGEIIIKGKNSKDFSGSDFDSYRNTYIGFIFQEYNILNEFNIEQNIELALQLQGKKNDKAAVNALLEQVDLKGLGKRKPNTLSGGQKQRVAIARALIKNPEIIMADEPTGALDSNTGKQVFDTLKKLSKEKLVIIVSHDRDFAEIYADRIIELADGKIISDTTKCHIEPKQINDNINIVNDNVLSIKNTNDLTRDDLDKLYDILKAQNSEVIITSNDKNIKAVRQAIHISDDNKSEVFNDTKEVETKEYDPKQTKFIKSHLPFSRAFKIGASSLKSKPVRMIFTIFLTIVALVMFGVTSTLMLYNESYSVSEALKNSDNDYEQISKSYKIENINHNLEYNSGKDEITSSYINYENTLFSKKDIDQLNQKSNNKYAGVIKFQSSSYYGSGAYPVLTFNKTVGINNNYYPIKGITGFIDAGEAYLNSNGFSILVGTYPTNYDEIAISDYVYKMLQLADSNIKSYDDVIYSKSNTLFESSLATGSKTNFKITAIINTGNIPSSFDDLKADTNKLNQNQLQELISKFSSYIGNSYHLMAYVSDNFYDYYKNNSTNKNIYVNGIHTTGLYITDNTDVYNYDISPTVISIYYSSMIIEKFKNQMKFYDINGNSIEYKAPNQNEIYLSKYMLDKLGYESNSSKRNFLKRMIENSKYTKDLYTEIYPEKDEFLTTIDKMDIDSSSFNDLYNEIYNKYSTDYLKIKNILDACNEFEEQYRKENDTVDESFISTFNDLYNTLNNEINKSNPDYGTTYINAVNDLGNFFNTYKNYINHAYLIKAANNNLYNPKDGSLNEELNSIVGDSNNIDYAKLKNYLETNNYAYKTYDLSYNELKISNSINSTKYYYKSSNGNTGELTVIGYYDGISNDLQILNDDFIKANSIIENPNIYYSERKTDYDFPTDAKYDNLIVKTSFSQQEISLMLSDFGSYKYNMTNQTYQALSIFLDIITTLKKVFLIIGSVFAVFAALMLFNFISSSIASKTKEIGILRAVGARGSDLFKIFFSESGIISIICVIISVIVSIIICNALNQNLAKNINMVLLDFGIINILLILLGAILIAIIGTFIPVFIASKKQPVDSIRTL